MTTEKTSTGSANGTDSPPEIAGCVYLATNKVNSKKYVGCTKISLKKRWEKHLNAAKNGSLLIFHRAIRKYGRDSFLVEILETVHGSRADLMAAEVHHVKEQGSKVPNGYNFTDGGDGTDVSDPAWITAYAEGLKKRKNNPTWAANNVKLLNYLHTDPGVRAAQVEGLRAFHKSPKGQKQFAEMLSARRENVMWVENLRVVSKLAAKKRTQDAIDRDLLFTEEEQEVRRRRREIDRRARARQKAKRLGEVVPDVSCLDNENWQATKEARLRAMWEGNKTKAEAKDLLCTEEERIIRVRKREACRRYRERKRLDSK